MWHSTIRDSIPLALFPKGFAYYAGGHVHTKIQERIPSYGTIAFPGALFGYRFIDLEDTYSGNKRGFFLVDFDNKDIKVTFEELDLPKVILQTFDGTDKTPGKINENLKNYVNSLDCAGQIVLIKITGILASGKPSEISVIEIKKSLEEKGALIVHMNRRALHAPEQVQPTVVFQSKDEIEEKLIDEFVFRYQNDPRLDEGEVSGVIRQKYTGKNGVATAKILLKSLQDEKKENEGKDDFETRILRDALKIISCGDE